MSWFGIDLPAIVGSGLNPAAQDATLIVVTIGARDADSTKGLTTSTANVSCRGYVQDYEEKQIDGDLITVNDRRVTLFANSLGGNIPKEKDQVTIDSATYKVRRVTRDPAGVAYQLNVRKG